MKRGFTLLELLIAVSILCSLMALSCAGLAAVRQHSIVTVKRVTKQFDDMARQLPDFN